MVVDVPLKKVTQVIAVIVYGQGENPHNDCYDCGCSGWRDHTQIAMTVVVQVGKITW